METHTSNQSVGVKILTDDEELNPILDFKDYGNIIVKMVRGSTPKFSDGIYGEWGTGKTTLMRIIENSLKEQSNHIVKR